MSAAGRADRGQAARVRAPWLVRVVARGLGHAVEAYKLAEQLGHEQSWHLGRGDRTPGSNFGADRRPHRFTASR